ncbi:MAG: GNAT family N-acetyltransferase [Candidatus Hodarchaeales archaeon]|jgi:RimJ/RimL family protein N-acetyltransferase
MELKFETKRLISFPITINDFYNAINNPEQFINKYSSPFPKSPYGGMENFKKFGSEVYTNASKDEKNYFWYTPWLIVLKENNNTIGIFNFKGPMTFKNEVTIGYGIEPQYRNNGYAIETVKGVIQWLKEYCNPESLLAFTSKDNNISHNVLKKNQFVLYKEIDEELIWKYGF